jgi:hypothetical protein
VLKQVYELPSDANRWYTELAAIRDLRSTSPLGRLQFPQMDPESPEGVALVLLSSGHFVEIVEYMGRRISRVCIWQSDLEGAQNLSKSSRSC